MVIFYVIFNKTVTKPATILTIFFSYLNPTTTLRSFRILYECFLLMYKTAPTALDSACVCSIVHFSKAIFVGEKLVFEIRIKSKPMLSSVRSA